jgi:UDP-apiose/xylose synthase
VASAKRGLSICILGAGGFIGSHLVARLLERGATHLVCVDKTSDKIRPYLTHPNLTFVNLDIARIDKLEPLVAQSDAVVQLTALCNPSLYTSVPLDVIEANFTRPFAVAKLCTRLGKRLVYFSTSEVYGKTIASQAGLSAREQREKRRYVLAEDTSPLILGPVQAQRWSYAAAKQLMERSIYALGFEQGLAYTIVRPFNFIGPRMDYIPGIDGEGVPRVLACFMEALMSGKPLSLVDGGRSLRCFTYIDDAIDAVEAILSRPDKARAQVFNIGNPVNEVTIRELAAKMVAVYRQLCPRLAEMEFVMRDVTAREFYGEGYEDSDRRMPDISKARKLLGWRPATDLDTALRLTMSSYVAEYGADCACREAC